MPTDADAACLAKALRDRFEADGALGARALPVRIAGRAASKQAGQSGAPQSSAPVQTRPAVDEDETRQRQVRLGVIDRDEVKGCMRCGLAATRTKTVFGVGSPAARIIFVGEGPGHDEDVSGIPFVGRAGELLTKMIEAGMGLKRDDVYICNVIKCRPPNNRTPAPDEIASCKDYLWRQIEIVQPEVIVALGAPAAQTLLNTREGIGRLRGQWHDCYPSGSALVGESIPLLPTFHPAYLLRSPGEKKKAWEDLKMVMARLGLPVPARKT